MAASARTVRTTARAAGSWLARLQGAYLLAGGIWPLAHRRSFEAVFGPKTDYWLVQTVSGLMLGNGLTQLAASGSAEGVRAARLLGTGSAAALGAVDLVYVPRGRLSAMYLLDAAFEGLWIAGWLTTRRGGQAAPG